MHPNKFILGFIFAIGIAASATAQITMRNSTTVSQNSHQGEAIDAMAREVEKRT